MVENSNSEDLTRDDDDGYPHDWTSNVVYLNNAGEAQLSSQVQKAGIQAITQPPWKVSNNNILDDQRDRIRQLFASLINAKSSKDIALMPSTAFAITFAARNIQRCCLVGRRRGGKILVLEDQMCSAIYPWQQICTESNYSVELKIVKYPTENGGWTEAVLNQIDDDVLVVCLPPLHWSDGSLLDLEVIGTACRRHGSIFIVDATQAVGIMPINLQRIQPSLLACSVHKWLRGPPGMSLVYVSPLLHNTWLPLDLHGRSRDFPGGKAWDASRHEMSPRGYPEKFYSDARKFDSGGKVNPILIPMLCSSMEEVARIDMQEAQIKLKSLITPLLEWAKDNGFILSPGPHAYHLVGLRPCNRTPEDLLQVCSKLQEKGIYIAVRCGVFRISPYLTTTPDEIRQLIQGFEDTLK